MNTLDALVTFSLLLGMIACPVLLARRLRFGHALVASLCIACVLVAMWAFWPSVHADLRLQELGFDASGMSEFERMANVPASAREEASRIYDSQMGIGWPLRALFLLPLVAICACIAVATTRFWRRRVAAA